MPLFTPSRLAIIVVSFSLITFLWTFGLPRPLAESSLPIIDHHDDKNVHADAIMLSPATHVTEQPPATGVPEYEEDGGRWQDDSQMNTTQTTDLKNGTDVAREKVTSIKESPGSYEEAVQSPTHDVAKFCKDVRGAQHVMVVIRTSKAEIKDKMPTNIKTLLECVPNFAIFSDHSGEMDGYKVHNALENISSDTKQVHDEFREYQIMHADAEHIPNPGKTKALDKWKFLPMVYQAYHLRPGARFFFFIESDTSLSWTNLLQWVDRLDYRIPYHSGAPTFMAGIQIAQQGSGIMLSQGALRRYVKSYDELYTSKWEAQISKECCGDLLLSMALNDAHVELYPSWPMLQGEQPSTLDYTQKLWCVPAVSWHRVNKDDLSGMWEKEKIWTEARGWEEPYLYRDAFHDHVESQIEIQRDDWDNISLDAKIVAPQGRQQQMREEAERKKKYDEEERKIEATEEKEVDEKKQADQDSKSGGKTLTDPYKAEGSRLTSTPISTLTSIPSPNPNSNPNRRPSSKPSRRHKSQTRLTRAKSQPQPQSTSNTKSTHGLNKRGDEKDATDWDKLADTFADAGDSSERCQKTCQDVSDCLQWRYTTVGDGECYLAKSVKLGKKAEENNKWVSGWLQDRIAKLAEEWKCEEANWRFYQ